MIPLPDSRGKSLLSFHESHVRFRPVDNAAKIHSALRCHVCGFRSGFAVPACVCQRAWLSARAARAGAQRRHGRATPHGAARRPHRRLDPVAPCRARCLHRACRRGDPRLSRGAWIVVFAWDEPAACRLAGADYDLGGRLGAGSRRAAAGQRPPGLRVWLGARHRLGGLHRRHFAVRAGGERVRTRRDRRSAGRAARRGGFCRHPGAGTGAPSPGRSPCARRRAVF